MQKIEASSLNSFSNPAAGDELSALQVLQPTCWVVKVVMSFCSPSSQVEILVASNLARFDLFCAINNYSCLV